MDQCITMMPWAYNILRNKYFDNLFACTDYLFFFLLFFCSLFSNLMSFLHPGPIIHDSFHFSFIWTQHLLFWMDLKVYVIGDLSFLVTFLITVTYLMAYARMRSLEIRMQLPFGNYMYSDWQGNKGTMHGLLASFLALLLVMWWGWSRQLLHNRKSTEVPCWDGQLQQLNGTSSMYAKDKHADKTN